MSSGLELFSEKYGKSLGTAVRDAHAHRPLLSPPSAWRILHQRTGGRVSRSTFYRWLDSGKVYSLRMGTRMYIPWLVLQEIIHNGCRLFYAFSAFVRGITDGIFFDFVQHGSEQGMIESLILEEVNLNF